MSPTPTARELSCPKCGWSKSCGPTAMLEQLRSVGMLRPGGTVEPELLVELLVAAAGKSTCPDCGRLGLLAIDEEAAGADWPDARRCDGCDRPISHERLSAVPDARLCAGCQEAIESGVAVGEAEYCPRCGAVMELKLSRGAGIARYRVVCPACRR